MIVFLLVCSSKLKAIERLPSSPIAMIKLTLPVSKLYELQLALDSVSPRSVALVSISVVNRIVDRFRSNPRICTSS